MGMIYTKIARNENFQINGRGLADALWRGSNDPPFVQWNPKIFVLPLANVCCTNLYP